MSPSLYKPIPEEELKARYWYISHNSFVKRLGVYAFILADAILVLAVLWQVISLYAIQLAPFSQNLRQMAQPMLISNPASRLVEPLKIGEVGAVVSSTTDLALYAFVQNPNTTFMARFTYYFKSDAIATPQQVGFIYPGQQKYLLTFGVASTNVVSPELKITDLKWERVTAIGQEKIKNETALTIDNYSLIQTTEGLPFNRLRFTLKNPTGYHYANIALPVVLRYGGRVVALNSTVTSDIKPLESRLMELHSFYPIGGVDEYIIQPDIDVFDPATFLAPLPEPASPTSEQ